MLLVYFTLLLVIVISCVSRPLDESKEAEILEFENTNDGFGGYSFYYETSNNIRRQETGQVLNPESENAILVVRGYYSYIGTDGQQYDVQYVADDNGFQPQTSNSIPLLPKTTTAPSVSFASSAAIGSLAGGGLGR